MPSTNFCKMKYDLKPDYDKLGDIHDKQRDLIENAKTEGRDMNDDENRQFDAWDKEYNDLEKAIERKLSMNERNAQDLSEAEQIAADQNRDVEQVIETREQKTNVLRKVLLGSDLTDVEKQYVRAQATSPDSAGGYLIDSELSDEIIKSMAFFGGMREASRIITTSTGGDLLYPTNNDIANVGSLLAENTAASEQDLTFGDITIGAYKYTTDMVRVSRELLQDSAFDVEAFLREQFAERIGRAVNTAYTNGNGSTAPEGIENASGAGAITETAGSAAITMNDFLTLKHSVDPAYRQMGAQFMMHDNILLEVKKLAIGSSDARSLWQPSFVVGEPATIDGDRYIINNDLPSSISADAHIAIYGNWDKFLIRDVRGLQIFRSEDRYFEFDQVAFVGFMRTDSKILDSSALKHLRVVGT